MDHTCTCGEAMQLTLRTVIYSGNIEIENVPIYTCEICHRSEVFQAVKGDLTSLIKHISEDEEKLESYRFEDRNELAWLLVKASDEDTWHESVQEIVEERINELLDMMLLAKSLHNDEWVQETRMRLRQLTDHYAISQAVARS